MFFPIFVLFSFSPDFFGLKFKPQPFKIETSYLVYWFTMTSCVVGLQMGVLLFVLPCVCPFFFLSRFFVKDISTTIKDSNFKFGIQVHNVMLYLGIENGHSHICSSMYFFLFSFSPDVSSKISPQPFKIETSNFVYRFTTTRCTVGLKMDLLPFVLLYVYFFSFSPCFSSKISPQLFKTGTLIWYTGSQRQVVSWN